MLDSLLSQQLRQHLTSLRHPIELVATVDDSAKSIELADLLEEIAALSDLVTFRRDGTDARVPSFSIERVGTPISVGFAGIPLGHEFTSLVLALLHVGGHPPKISDELAAQVQSIPGTHHFETFFSLSCQNCPDVVQALNVISVLNPNITHVAIDGAAFTAEAERRQVLAVPSVFHDGESFASGRMTVEQIVAMLDVGALERAAAEIDHKDPFDVLVVGGGPAGAASAIYTVRKGVRTGVVAERFGGQVLDTMGIENFISVARTEGPKLAAVLEEHVKDHDVDVMHLQRATKLIPAEEPGGLITVQLESGAQLAARSVVVATGARWRHMDVPGESDYLNRGVAFCPHCDGPLFAGKRIAVIGGGNSGVEAAIDLAGIVEHVTLIEFDSALRADDVLQRKLRSLPNVDVVAGALTTEVLGNGERVTGLVYLDRATDTTREVSLAGIFVQIGLLPNTDWLQGSVELSDRGEVVIDDRGRTSVPGVFAAGDCTTVPFKQIVIALGAGATAGLSAFDHLIRTSAPTPEQERERELEIRGVNLRDLEYVVALAEHRHFGRAAEACFVSQPTLSTQIHKLESELGVVLFERGETMPTAVGAEIVAHARTLLIEAGTIREVARSHHDPTSATIRLGIFPTLAPYLLPHVIPTIHDEFPKLELLIVEEKTEELLRRLGDGRLDVAIVATPISADGLHCEVLFEEDFVLATPIDHPLALRGEPVPVGALVDEHVLLLEEGHCLRDQALSVCQLVGAVEREGFRATSLETLRQMVAAGVAVTLLPRLAVSPPVANAPGVALLTLEAPVPSRQIAMFWRTTSAYGGFLPRLAELFRQLPAGLVRPTAD